MLAETNSSYTEAVNDCVRVFCNGLSDGSEEELEIVESKQLSAREMLDKNVGVVDHELTIRKKWEARNNKRNTESGGRWSRAVQLDVQISLEELEENECESESIIY